MNRYGFATHNPKHQGKIFLDKVVMPWYEELWYAMELPLLVGTSIFCWMVGLIMLSNI
jgi:hypothetical protein